VRSIVPNASRADKRHRCQKPRRELRLREPAAADAEPTDRFHRDFASYPDTSAVYLDSTSRAIDAAALPERQPGRASGHQRVRIGILHDLPPESQSEHVATLRDYAQSQCVAGKDRPFHKEVSYHEQVKAKGVTPINRIMMNWIVLVSLWSNRSP